MENNSHVNDQGGLQQSLDSNKLTALFKPLGELASLLMWLEMYPNMVWAFEQAKVEERLGREVTAREKDVYIKERFSVILTPELFHQLCEELVTDPGLRQQLHDACDNLCEQAEVDEELRLIAHTL